MTSASLIIASAAPDCDAVLEADLCFHMGERDWYNFRAMEQVCTREFPHKGCAAFERSRFLGGGFYRRFCKIEGSEVLCYAPRPLDRMHLLVLIAIQRDLPLMESGPTYFFDLWDRRYLDYGSFFETNVPIPVFQYHRYSGRAAIINPLPHYHEYPSQNNPPLVDRAPFRAKKSRMFWRGRLHGTVIIGDEKRDLLEFCVDPQSSEADRLAALRQSLRVRLCEAASQTDALDAGLTINWANPIWSGSGPVPMLEALRREKISPADQLENKYLLALDGYDGPSVHYWAHATNSLVLRQESPWQMFGDSYFAPWVHYVPFSSDGSDLFEKFEWCERNQTECERMVENAKRAWSILFDPGYQCERRKAVFARYYEWYKDSL